MQVGIYVKRGLLILLSQLVVLSTIPINSYASEKMSEEYNVSDGFELAARNDHLELYYNVECARIIVRNRISGHVWDSAYSKDKIPENFTEAQRQEVTSLFNLTYSTASYFSSKTSTCSLDSKEYTVNGKKIKDGFEYSVYIPEFDVNIRLEITLNEYGVLVSIPEGGIEENVESEKVVLASCETIVESLEEEKKYFNGILEDTKIPKDLKKNLEEVLQILENMQKTLEDIESAIGISAVCTQLAKDIERIDTLLFGKADIQGFYPGILESKKIEDTEKNEHRQYMQTINAWELTTNIQIAQLKEISAITLVSINLLPYFGAAGDDAEGYMVYPDGCGALTYFKDKHGAFSSFYKADTYTSLSPDINWEEINDSLGLSNVAVPYFGIKTGDDACLGYVSGGGAQSSIMFSPSGYVIPINRIGAGFTYRQTVATSSVSGQWQSVEDTMIFEREMQTFDASVQFFFLEGENADYSGMATVLREYMVNEGILEKSPFLKEEKVQLAVDVFGGYNEQILAIDNYVVGTSLSQTEQIMDALEEIPVFYNYQGIFKEGYDKYPTKYEVSEKLGEPEELDKLSQKAKENGGYLFAESDQLIVDYDSSNYDKGELAIGNQYTILQNKEKNQYLLSPQSVKERQEEVLFPELGQYDAVGIAEKSMGSFIYSDYSEKQYCSRLDTVKKWKNILEEEKNKFGAIAVDEGSDYTFAAADWIRNAPNSVSGYIYTDEEIPFYMMLIHGYLNYTTMPNNQYYNPEIQLLKAIEYGYMPYYSICGENIDSREGTYMSEFDKVHDDMVKTYNTYISALGGLVDEPMIHHKKEGDISEVCYANGEKIIINYGNEKVTVDNKVVEGKSFIKIGKSEVKTIEKQEIKSSEKGKQNGVSVYPALVPRVCVVLLVSIVLLGCIGVFYRHRS